MQFVPIPILNLIKPNLYPASLCQIMSMALASDLQKYTYAMTFNELSISQKDDKKSQNIQTATFSSNLSQEISEKPDKFGVGRVQRNRKIARTFDQEAKCNPQMEVNQSKRKRRQCFQKARCQITHALESQEESFEQQRSDCEQRQQQIVQKNKGQLKCGYKKNASKKPKKMQKIESQICSVLRIVAQPSQQIVKYISLIETVDHPLINIDRYEIQLKKESLLSRAIVYQESQHKKYTYQIRQRRQLKKLN